MAAAESVKTVNGPRNLGLEKKLAWESMENGGLPCTEWHGRGEKIEGSNAKKLGLWKGIAKKKRTKGA